MTQGDALSIFRTAILVTIKLAGPILVLSIVIGLVIAIFQAATQIHEQTLTFVPKVLVIALLLMASGSWMINVLSDFMKNIFDIMAGL